MPKNQKDIIEINKEHKKSINIINQFKSFLKSYRSASENTIKSYTKDVMYFFKVLGLTEYDYNNLNTLKLLNNEHMKMWLIDRKKTNSNRSISRQIISIKTLFIFLDTIYNITNEVFLGLNGMKFNPNLPKAINHDIIMTITQDIDKIMKYKYNFECERDKLIILLLYSTGLRISEALQLKVKDIQLSTVRITGKGSKERIVPILPIIHKQLKTYINAVKNDKLPSDITEKCIKSFFINNKGKQLTARDIERVFQNIKNYKGLNAFSPHIMRHSFATSLLENGANIQQIKELLGHENLATTQKYTKITEKKLSEKLKKIGW